MTTGFKIQEMFAFVATHEDGDEGVVAVNTREGWMPLVGADRSRIESLAEQAQLVSSTTNRAVKLVSFALVDETPLDEVLASLKSKSSSDAGTDTPA